MLNNRWLFEPVDEDTLDRLSDANMSSASNWLYNGGAPTMESLKRESPEVRRDILEYLEECPIYESVTVNGNEYLLVHGGLGGFEKDKPIEDYTLHDLLWSRPTLSTYYDPEKYTVIVGHTPTLTYSRAFYNRMIKVPNGWWNIDTGAAMEEGRPMLLCLDTLKEYYIEDDTEIIEIQG
jgi:serine/threonine protein phosphatase 1